MLVKYFRHTFHRLFVAFLFVEMFSCTPGAQVESVKPQLSIHTPTFISTFSIYILGNETLLLSSVLEQAKQSLKTFPQFEQFPDSIVDAGFQAKAVKEGDDEFIPADLILMSIGDPAISEEEATAFKESNEVIQLSFFGTKENVFQKQKSISEFIHALVNNRRTVIADFDARMIFSPATWKLHRIDGGSETPNMTQQVTIHMYRDEEFCRAVTLGMNKFCLPEISMKNITCSDQNTFGNLVNAVIQTLGEAETINSDSTLTVDLAKIKNKEVREFLMSDIKEDAKKKVEVKLRSVDPEEGDNLAAQLAITFENPNYKSPQEEQHALVEDLFGAYDALTYTQHDNELLKASEQARTKLPDLRKKFNDGLAPGYSIMVKKAFKTDDGGNEWMWVEVTKWSGEEMEGILQNEPYEIKDLQAGAVVAFKESEIFDYIYNKPDGTYEGNETGKIIEGRN